MLCGKAYEPLSIYHTMPPFNNLEKKILGNIVGKGENAGNQHFLLFLQCFLSIKDRSHNFRYIEFVVCRCVEFGSFQKFVVW